MATGTFGWFGSEVVGLLLIGSTIDFSDPTVLPANIARNKLEAIKQAAMIPVVLVIKFAELRAETKPPMVPPPIPNAPPSLRCNKTTITRAIARNK